MPRHTDLTIGVIGCIDAWPRRWAGRGHRCGMHPLLHPTDQIQLPDPALELPDPQSYEQRHADNGKGTKTEQLQRRGRRSLLSLVSDGAFGETIARASRSNDPRCSVSGCHGIWLMAC